MKKLYIIFAVIFLLVLSSCTAKDQPVEPPQEPLTSQGETEELALADRLYLQFGIDEFESNAYCVYLYGDEEKLITDPIIPFANSNFYEHIIMLDETTALIGYKYIYTEGAEKAEPIALPFAYIFHAAVSPDKSKIAYYAKQGNDISVSFCDIAAGRIHNVKKLNLEDCSKFFEMSLFLDWGDNESLYFDSPKNNLPTIEMYNIKDGSFTQIAEGAKRPSVSDDNSTVSYIEHSTYVGTSTDTPITVIKRGEATQKFEGYSAVKYSDFAVYRVDYTNSQIDKLDISNLELLSSVQVGGEIVGASVRNGVLNYYILTENNNIQSAFSKTPEIY